MNKYLVACQGGGANSDGTVIVPPFGIEIFALNEWDAIRVARGILRDPDAWIPLVALTETP